MKKFNIIFVGGILSALAACDLQPKIMALPDSVGEFISVRYPALLADPNTQPEIYNSAATDYGVYAAPELYGNGATVDDYVMYASVDDYIVPPQQTDADIVYGNTTEDVSVDNNMIVWSQDAGADASVQVAETDKSADVPTDDFLVVPMYGPVKKLDVNQIVVVRGDTVYSLAKRYSTTANNIIEMNGLKEPYLLKIGQKLNVPAVPNDSAVVDQKTEKKEDVPNVIAVPQKKATGVQTTTKVQLENIVVQPGDTLYSLSRRYAVPVNDLAVLNNLQAPFALAVGQKIRVPNLKQAATAKVEKVPAVKTDKTTVSVKVVEPVKVAGDKKTSAKAESTKVAMDKSTTKKDAAPVKTETKKISSDPSKKLPAITARSSSKFSWPVKGKVLSHYGAKSNGLFNDGINISANQGTAVKAAENGVVAYAGNEVKGMGNLIIIQHSGGWMTVYAHMDSMSVRRGAKVAVGQKIGTVGKTGKVDKPQLHFEIRKGTKAYNPSAYLKK